MKLCQKRRIYGNLSAAQEYFLSFITVAAFFPFLASSPKLVVGNNEGMSKQGDLESSSVILRLSSSSVFSVSLRVRLECC